MLLFGGVVGVLSPPGATNDDGCFMAFQAELSQRMEFFALCIELP